MEANIMTFEEKLHLNVKCIELEKQGKLKEASEIQKHIPLPAYLAKWAKDHMGSDFVRNLGWDLSEAEAEYGKSWLNC
jgi:hypothetical protein